jgi:hypothetical protein
MGLHCLALLRIAWPDGRCIRLGTNLKTHNSFPRKVKTRKAFKRSQGLQSPEALPRAVCNSIYLVFAPVTRHAWSRRRDSCDCDQIRWNLTQGLESVCFKYSPNIKQASKKTGNQTGNHMRPKVRQDTAEARQCKKGRFWFYPRRGSRRAQQGKARRGEPLNSIRLPCTNPEESEDCRPNQSVWSLL